MITPWGEALDDDAPLPEHPRPQLVRDSYVNLNGRWDHAFTSADAPTPDRWDGPIVVPFSPEAPLSGVGRTLQPDEALWYRRAFTLPGGFVRDRVLLHLGAVDQDAQVWVDGTDVGGHRGGYLPFTLDVTDALVGDEHEVVVRVRDVTDTSYRGRGKQKLAPGGIWYTAQSGIWQTVWLESVPARWVDRLVLTPHLAEREVEVTVVAGGGAGEAEVVVSTGGREVVRRTVPTGVPTRLPLGDDVRTWSPDDPHLYDVEVRLGDDRVTSYVGMRSFGVGPDAHGRTRLLLNGEPYLHAGLLDQGYWPDGLYTAPSDDALVHDIRTAKDLGFTMLRKHIKIEPLRWYHHCDRLGMLVWQDMVNGGRTYHPAVVTAPVVTPLRLDDSRYRVFGRQDAQGRDEFLAEADATVELLRSVPSVAVWVPFNEGWGQFDAAAAAARVAALDPTRPVDHASGWHDQGAGDLVSRHVYFRPYRLSRADAADPRAAVLSEYGGYSHRVAGHTWSEQEFGYRRYRDRGAFERAFLRLQHAQVGPAVDDGLAAFVYTQLADVEEETNGLLTYDRRVVKVGADAVRASNRRLRARHDAAAGVRAAPPLAVTEREITAPVSLTLPDGRLNPDAVGWTRTPLVTTDGIGRGARGLGRNKRWEYWAVTTPTHVVALVVSAIDYAAVHGIWVLDRTTGQAVAHDAIGVLTGSATLPGTLGGGKVRASTRAVKIAIDEVPGGTRLRARGDRVRVDVVAHRPEGHESLGVVVPWSETLFQYTVKDVARPATGTVWVDGVAADVPAGESWATLDHGRGRWPYDVRWNWGAGSGRTDGRVIGLQVGGRWTDGTGSVENSLVVDGRLTKISEELVWEYDRDDWLAPWHVTGTDVELTLTPFHLKQSVTDLTVFAARTSQCFGHWEGRVRDSSGTWVPVRDVVGWAEDVHNRW
ncbi:MAG: DUF2804 family protein [Cellulomonas sp.]|uniref:DUF2804 family protein n=1 Tax=Cellulomonas sp. TaxID=40001 RepID=UPI0019E17396|nr:DUF2804 family protein [Cellulomonas sp.]MBF0688341.1 DUF2804 family protein [Cellulomonas sp.]